MARGSRRVLLIGLVVALVAGMTAAAFVLDQPEVVAGEAELSPKSIDVSGAIDDKVVTGKNGRTQVTVPVSWAEADKSWRRRGSLIHVGIKSREDFFAVYDYDKRDFAGLDAFVRHARPFVLGKLEMVLVTPPQRRTINGMRAVQNRIGTSRDANSRHWIVFVRGKHSYYILLGNDLFTRNHQMLKIIDSFREITPNT